MGHREVDGFSRGPGEESQEKETSEKISSGNENVRMVCVEGNLPTSWSKGREGGGDTSILVSPLRTPPTSWPDFSHRLHFLKVLPSPKSTWAVVQGLTHTDLFDIYYNRGN